MGAWLSGKNKYCSHYSYTRRKDKNIGHLLFVFKCHKKVNKDTNKNIRIFLIFYIYIIHNTNI